MMLPPSSPSSSSSSSSSTLSGRTVRRSEQQGAEDEEDEMVLGKNEQATAGTAIMVNDNRGGTIAGPQHHQQQQQQQSPPGKPSLSSSRRRRRRRGEDCHFEAAATTTRLIRRRSTTFFILLLASALTLALSSLYFSTTLTTRRSNEDEQQNNPRQQQQQQQPEITPPNVPSAATTTKPNVHVVAVESESESKNNTRDMQTEPDLSSLPHRNNHHRTTDSSTAANDADAATTTITRTKGDSENVGVVVDNNNKHRRLEHPYWGARDENGQSGHVHDPTAHTRRPFTISNQERRLAGGLCDAAAPGKKQKNGNSNSIVGGGEMGARALQKVQISSASSPSSSDYDNNNKNDTNPIRLFCAIYTHTGAIEQTNALLETWAPRCDGLLLASNATNATTHHVHIPHKSVAEGKYKGIWQRVRAMMAYLYENFLNDYDYFHFCGDDTYVLVENLKAFLSSAQVANATNHGERPLFAGYWVHLKFWGDEYPEDFYFLSGGPGYTLSRSALKAFVEQALPTCRAKNDDPFEDLNVAWCFYHMLNISGIDTRDETGAQRYHPMSAEMHAKFPAQKVFGPPSFMVRKTKEHMEKEFGFPTLYGLDDISSSSVAFHYLKTPAEIRLYEMLLYGTGREQCVSF